MTDLAELEKLAAILEESDDFRVLRRLKQRPSFNTTTESESRLGLFVDVETTGLDPIKDEIIEIALLPFQYSLEGEVIALLDPFDRLRQPLIPIPPSITALTGISDERVEGQKIDPDELLKFAEPADLIVAHNAAFDRRFLERFCPAFCTKPWACSMEEIGWAEEGFEGTKLAYLALGYGFFYDRHRAANDCFAGVELLSQMLPQSGVSGLSCLLTSARQTTWRIWATSAPFEFKDRLKARGYRWNGGENGRPRSWYVDIQDDQKDTEFDFLWRDIYKKKVDIDITKITAIDRYSVRV